MKPITHRETMFAEMRPDMYGGESCDVAIPQWFCVAEGDKGGGDHSPDIAFSAGTFPPGTQIRVSVPECPVCGETADLADDNGRCDCGFDWRAWAEAEYS